MKKILMVCLGNICRSPAAEGVLCHQLEAAGLQAAVQVDSAGTAGWHSGNLADARMRRAAKARGMELVHRARQVTRADLDAFDLVLAMDRQNLSDLQALAVTSAQKQKLRLFCSFCRQDQRQEVPDPYEGGPEDFEDVLNLLEDGCAGLVDWLRQNP
jgi:protein-tyrosine phosphatase